MKVKQRQAQREAGAKWFRSLSAEQKFQLGDAFVLDTFSWENWFSSQPSTAFLRGVEKERIYWESEEDE